MIYCTPQKRIDTNRKSQKSTMAIFIRLCNKSDLNGYCRRYPESSAITDITLQNFKDQAIKEFKDTKDIIIDIRNCPSTFVLFKLGNYLNSNRSDFVKFTQDVVNQLG